MAGECGNARTEIIKLNISAGNDPVNSRRLHLCLNPVQETHHLIFSGFRFSCCKEQSGNKQDEKCQREEYYKDNTLSHVPDDLAHHQEAEYRECYEDNRIEHSFHDDNRGRVTKRHIGLVELMNPDRFSSGLTRGDRTNKQVRNHHIVTMTVSYLVAEGCCHDLNSGCPERE